MIEILKYTEINKGIFVGTFDIRVLKWGPIDIIGMKLYQKENKKWLSFPQNSRMEEGKPVYFPVMKFTDNQMLIKFMDSVMSSLNEFLDKNGIKVK